jgi:hypothetical protein
MDTSTIISYKTQNFEYSRFEPKKEIKPTLKLPNTLRMNSFSSFAETLSTS